MQSIGINGTVTEVSISDCEFLIEDRTAIICKDLELTLHFINTNAKPVNVNNLTVTGVLQDGMVSLMTVQECKGLEFETVYVFDYNMSENEKYVAYTRALNHLIVISDSLEELQENPLEQTTECEYADVGTATPPIDDKSNLSADTLPSQSGEISPDFTEAIESTDKDPPNFIEVQDAPPHNTLLPEEETTSKSAQEQRLETELARLSDYFTELDRRLTAIEQSQLMQKEKIYNFALQKISTHSAPYLKDAIYLLETIIDYKDSMVLIDQAKQELEIITHALETQRSDYRAQNLCQYCGGMFHGSDKQYCCFCGREKDY